MTENMKLSQAEIDALLNSSSPFSAAKADETALSAEERDALGEIGNISLGAAATSLSLLLQQRVEITTPEVMVFRAENFRAEFPRPYVMVSVDYLEGISGANSLAVELDDARKIADLMLGGDGTNAQAELNELHLSAVSEAMNQMMGGASTAMSTVFGRTINISPPKLHLVDLSSADDPELGMTGWVASISFRLRVGELIDSRLIQLIPLQSAKEMVRSLGGAGDQAENISSPASTIQVPKADVAPTDSPQPIRPVSVVHSTSADRESVQSTRSVASNGSVASSQQTFTDTKTVHRPEFVDFSSTSETASAPPRNLSLLFDVTLTVTVELGRTKRVIKDILDLAPGSVLELDKLAGEPVDILVNNKRIAKGEVVVIEENFGVRVTDIISPVERVQNLR